MSGLSETLRRLGAQNYPGVGVSQTSRLQPLDRFGKNPGGLTAKLYLPADLKPRAALVVVLHGCTQTADGYDRGSGWSALAERQGFALLHPEQNRANNPNLCFNWFEPGDIARGCGEVESIREMIATMVATHKLDPEQIFVTGLSAGGAMTAALLAAYPELFAGGAIIAGLPAGSATSMPQALQQMRRPSRSSTSIRAASGYQGRGPIISVWHGDQDMTVASANADEIVAQWRDFHGASTPGVSEHVDGHRRTVWRDARGNAAVEQFSIGGMGHGVPLATSGSDALGSPAPYMLDAGISSTRHIARFWGLHGARSTVRPATTQATSAKQPPHSAVPVMPNLKGPGQVIENALRAAGLMR